MYKYKFIPNVAIADICFEAYGKNLNLLFKNAALALTEVMLDTKDIKNKLIRKISLKTDDLENLLLQFLEELVYLKDSEKLVFRTFKIHIFYTKPVKLIGEMHGEKIDPFKHKLRTDIKAVTHYMFELKKDKSYWRARIVVDV